SSAPAIDPIAAPSLSTFPMPGGGPRRVPRVSLRRPSPRYGSCDARRRRRDPLGVVRASLFQRIVTMLSWVVVFLILALVAAVFGFGGIASGAAGIAKILFFVFLVLLVISLIFGRRTVT